MLQQDLLRRSFERLHDLQTLHCAGQFASGSPEHSEILVLEELESLLVREEMRRFYQAKLRLADRVKTLP